MNNDGLISIYMLFILILISLFLSYYFTVVEFNLATIKKISKSDSSLDDLENFLELLKNISSYKEDYYYKGINLYALKGDMEREENLVKELTLNGHKFKLIKEDMVHKGYWRVEVFIYDKKIQMVLEK